MRFVSRQNVHIHFSKQCFAHVPNHIFVVYSLPRYSQIMDDGVSRDPARCSSRLKVGQRISATLQTPIKSFSASPKDLPN